MAVRALARVPGTWGELVQGALDGVDFLITCPVDLWVDALASAGRAGADLRGAGRTHAGWRAPPGREKVAAVLASLPGRGRVRIWSPLRPGAGMGSSTADMAAALAAAAAAGGRPLDPLDVFRRCLAVEPTDGLMLPGIALVDHRRGRRVEPLGPAPPLVILGVDPGGAVPTRDFNRREDLDAANRRKEPLVREAHDLAVRAVAAGDPAALAAAATLSARAHQAILPNPLWERATALAREIRALGLNVAHSGVVLGFLLDPRHADAPAARAFLERRLGLPVRFLRLVPGGVRVASLGREFVGSIRASERRRPDAPSCPHLGPARR
ncbi:GHMP family kinase ATP-binding protein [Caldinitratiruptor microaerophilus]|uniref:GHMP kinase n=1 Tax=Caldinitratiruptor microaerophilus TaxID=671077 RepID=A0AA35G8U3_9FIRM|nr:GHMP kinase [Caldinitratiruptor microaerophilus]BDG59599.1 GHMP kinase [Caldinitratiruptor microaerophilus]